MAIPPHIRYHNHVLAFPPAPFVRPRNKKMEARAETTQDVHPQKLLYKYKSTPQMIQKPLPPIPLFCAKRRERAPRVSERKDKLDNQERIITLNCELDTIENTDPVYEAERIAWVYGFDVIYVARLDLALLQQSKSLVEATLLVSGGTSKVPCSVPAEMYQKRNSLRDWCFHTHRPLPNRFLSGFSRFFFGGQGLSGPASSPVLVFTCLYKSISKPAVDFFALHQDAETLVEMVSFKSAWL